MAKLIYMPENYPEFKEFIICKKEGCYYLRRKTQQQLQQEAARVKAGLEPDRTSFFEWVNKIG
ncbi:hypothetical protein QRD02_08600 [Aequorivita sp. SDUM287046]|uniref:Uncharacterized protein n=1 Tax=Aequorivita aurantiaca TaxID=3053356 RepID=A0ABT8DGD6_9FLAO|nr:hypothetical protein [Aequorivita aurantiaca]MDN3724441.1 hypothetical protein [Aequorivita aurantiaca]